MRRHRGAAVVCDNRVMRLLALRAGHGDVLIAEGDVAIPEQEQALFAAFRAQLDQGMWAAVPLRSRDGRREAQLVRTFDEVPLDAERVIFFPRAAGGS